MASLVLPRWLVYSKAHRSGRRLFPKPKISYFTKAKADSRLPSHYSGATTITESDLPGQFENWEYRFWGPVTTHEGDKVLCWQCRACMTMVLDKAARKDHHERDGCTRKLVDAYNICLDKSFCVVCNVYTKAKRWGVPLCSKRCQTAFTSQTGLVQPFRITEALEKVKIKHDAVNGS